MSRLTMIRKEIEQTEAKRDSSVKAFVAKMKDDDGSYSLSELDAMIENLKL